MTSFLSFCLLCQSLKDFPDNQSYHPLRSSIGFAGDQVCQQAPIWSWYCLQRSGITSSSRYLFWEVAMFWKKKKIIKKPSLAFRWLFNNKHALQSYFFKKMDVFFLIMKNILLPPYGTTNDSPTDLRCSILSWPYVTVLLNGWVIHARHILVYQLKLLEVCMICVSVIKPC